jgi:hypothetical protein
LNLTRSLDSLYNPYYGYFPKQAVIFDPGEAFRFSELKDDAHFHRLLSQRYTSFEDELDEKEVNETRQLWHTPTELFKPYYGEAIARHLVTNYKLTLYPYNDLLIYEMGAGNGTLMLNVLDYIRDAHPEVYERTRYKIIEISSSLAALQQSQLMRVATDSGHRNKVEIINRSIFDWDIYVPSPCYFLALEVLDNFAHDCIRYDYESEQPLQCHVLVDRQGDFYEFYERAIDPVASRYFSMRECASSTVYDHPLQAPKALRNFRSSLPLAANLSTPEYIPTRQMQFFDILRDFFPAHKLVISDFHSLPQAVEGFTAPVAQTRYQRRTIPVTTPLVSPLDSFICYSIVVACLANIGLLLYRYTKVTSTSCSPLTSP